MRPAALAVPAIALAAILGVLAARDPLAADAGRSGAAQAIALPPGAVMRVSRGRFDPADFAAVDGAIRTSEAYLAPAIAQLDGLLAYYAGTSPDGTTVQVSIWADDASASQMRTLTAMTVRARGEAEAAGVTFEPVLQMPVSWTVWPP